MAELKQIIPEGYKQTELGVIPEDWSISTLGDVLTDFRNGYAFSAKGYCSSGTPILTMAQIGLSGSFQFDEEKVNRWDDHHFNKLKDFWVLDGDLLIAMTDVTPDKNLIGQMTVAKLQSVALLNQRVGLLRVNSQKGIPSFFSYLSCLPVWKSYCKGVASLGVQANIGTNDIRKALVPLPTVKEQTAIANVLSDVDALISELEKFIAKKQAIKTATMQQLLTGKTRLPEFALREDGTPKGYKASELGEIPEDWEVVEFGAFIQNVIDNRGKTPPLASDGFPMVEVNAIYKQGKSPNLEKVVKYVSKSTYECWFRDGHPEIGNILLVTVGSAGEASFVDKEGFCIAQNLIGLKINRMYSSEFVYYITRSVPFKKQVDAVLMGAVQPSLKVPHLSKFLFPLSKNKQEQTTIAAILSDMDEEIQTLQQRLNKTRQIKQGMMQELLTGKTRLVKPEVIA